MELKNDGDTNYNWHTRYSRQKISTRTVGLGNKRVRGDHPSYCIIKMGQNTEKSRGNLRRFTVTQDSGGKPSVKAGMKSSQICKIIISIFILIINESKSKNN